MDRDTQVQTENDYQRDTEIDRDTQVQTENDYQRDRDKGDNDCVKQAMANKIPPKPDKPTILEDHIKREFTHKVLPCK